MHPLDLFKSLFLSFLERGSTSNIFKGSAMALFFILILAVIIKKKGEKKLEREPRTCTLPWMNEEVYYEIFKEKTCFTPGGGPDHEQSEDSESCA